MLRNLRRLGLRSSVLGSIKLSAVPASARVELKQARRSYMQIAREYNKKNGNGIHQEQYRRRSCASRSISAITADNDDDKEEGSSSSSSSSNSDSDSSSDEEKSDEEKLNEMRKNRYLNDSSHTQSSIINDENEGIKKIGSTTNNAHKIPRLKKEYYSLLKYFPQFNNDTFKTENIYSIPSGGYTHLDRGDLTQTLPEGLAGETEEEFSYTDNTSWMMREPTKIVCRLLDEFKKRKMSKLPIKSPYIPHHNKAPMAYRHNFVSGLTDRPEWSDAETRVFYYSKEIQANKLSELHRQGVKLRKDGERIEGLDPDDITDVKRVDRIVTDIIALHPINEYDDNRRVSDIPTKVLLNGDRGSGKSVILNQVVYHARKNGWICLFIPNGWDHAQEGMYIDPIFPKRIGNTGNQLFDNCLMSVDALRGFYKAHQSILATIKLSDHRIVDKYEDLLKEFTESWNRNKNMPGRDKMGFIKLREIIIGEDEYIAEEDDKDQEVLASFDYPNFQVKTLRDLCLLGVCFRQVSGSVFIDIVEELKKLNIPDHPVLIAVDQYNTWEVPSVYKYNHKEIHAKDLCVPNALQFLSTKRDDAINWMLTNGMCIAATSFAHSEGRRVNYKENYRSIPLLIQVPLYNRIEFLSALSNYTKFKLLDDEHTFQEILGYRSYCGSNPWQTRVETGGYFFPLAMDDDNVFNDFSTLDFDDSLEKSMLPFEFHYIGGDSEIVEEELTLGDKIGKNKKK